MMRKTNAVKVILLVLVTLTLVAMSLLGACAKEAPAPAPTPAPTPAPKPAPAPAPAPKPAPIKIELKATTFVPPIQGTAVIFQDCLKEINERAKGELIINYLGGPEVVPMKELPLAVRDGVIDMTLVNGSGLTGFVPEMIVLGLSRISLEEEIKVGVIDYLRERLAKKGLHFFGRHNLQSQTFYWVVTKVKIERLQEDFKGLRYGHSTITQKTFMEALGMSYTEIKMRDMYAAFDQGMVDVLTLPFSRMATLHIQEVAKYVINHPFLSGQGVLIMNLDTWNKLPKHLQELIVSTLREYEPKWGDNTESDTVKAKKIFKDAGVETLTFSEEDAKWFIDLAYTKTSDVYIKLMPETAPALLKKLGAIK